MTLPTTLARVEPTTTGRPWRRDAHHAGLTRRQLLRGGVGLAGAAAAAGAVGVHPASAHPHNNAPVAPRPIPGGIQPFGPGTEVFHVFLPGQGEPGTITDFHGVTGIAEVQGHGTGANTGRAFDCDMRFMSGQYVGVDGKRHLGTFGFV
jgi:hypothetical protein